jgi:calcineurin-like phosphoesterase family protein
MKINLEQHQQLFFTSDTHYMHKNICRGVTNWIDAEDITRDFKTLDQMNDRIVNGINTLVGQDDILFHLGDWSFGGFEMIEQFRNRINCQNIHLILGNHDHHIERDREDIRRSFTSVHQYLELEVIRTGSKRTDIYDRDYKQKFVLMHYPLMSWNKMNDGVIHLHGHVHLPPDKRMGKGKMMDVGMDGNGLDVININEIIRKMYYQPIASGLPFDHHIKRVE